MLAVWRAIYALALWLAFPWLWIKLWWRGRAEPGYRDAMRERFGWYASTPVSATNVTPASAANSPLLWVHAVSVGETRAAQPLIAALTNRYPLCRLLITHMTATGRDTAREIYGGMQNATFAWLPYDYPGAMKRFLARHRPALAIIMETEIWPNLLAECRATAVPVLLANARLSERSARGYARVGPLARAALANFSAIGAQTRDDAQRLIALGADAAKVSVTGNLKFDAATPAVAAAKRGQRTAGGAAPPGVTLKSQDTTPPISASPKPGSVLDTYEKRAALEAGGASPGGGEDADADAPAPQESLRERMGARPVLLAASTRDGEEAMLLGALRDKLLPPEVLLVIVPRHPQRFDEVARLLAERGFSFARRSFPEGIPGAVNWTECEVLLGDSMGEMPAYYAACDCAFIGGSLLPLGGQNLIEACALGVPVFVGPHTFNFTQAAEEAVQAGAAVRVSDAPQLFVRASRLLKDRDALARMRAAGLAFVAAHRGATERTVAVCERLLKR